MLLKLLELSTYTKLHINLRCTRLKIKGRGNSDFCLEFYLQVFFYLPVGESFIIPPSNPVGRCVLL